MFHKFVEKARAMERPESRGCDSDVLENYDQREVSHLGSKFKAIEDRFTSLGEVRREIKKVVNVEVGLIFGIDFTMSNRVQGLNTFGGKNLHTVESATVNPYQQVICILGETLESLAEDGIIPAFGFGDSKVKGDGIFPLKEQGECEGFNEVLEEYNKVAQTVKLAGPTNFAGECEGFNEVLEEYNKVAQTVKLAGPTNFAPLIEKAIEIVKSKKQFHVLVIVADGQVSYEEEAVEAIVQASNYPLSIVVIGVGDGPWEVMQEFDDKLPKRRFDNFQFVDFHKTKASARNPEAAVALASLMLIPDQFKEILKHGLLRNL